MAQTVGVARCGHHVDSTVRVVVLCPRARMCLASNSNFDVYVYILYESNDKSAPNAMPNPKQELPSSLWRTNIQCAVPPPLLAKLSQLRSVRAYASRCAPSGQ